MDSKNEIIIEVNKITTPITSSLLETFPKEVREEFLEIIESTEFIKHLISRDRKYAKNLEKDSSGKILIDVTKPHILEDIDYFRPAALHFEKYGCYTKLYPNKNPNSEYYRFWKEETRRCYEGYIRESDGEWIPGDFYFYLNYCPIVKVIKKENSKRGQRIVGFPEFYDGDYLVFHYLEQSFNLGHHSDILKSRGKGYSFKGGGALAKSFILGDTEIASNNIKAYAIANEKEYLVKDGILNKFVDTIDFIAEHTPFPRLRIKNSLKDMHWKLGYIDSLQKIEKGKKNEVIGVTLKNDPQKARGKRGSRILWEENGKFPCFLQAWQIARPSVEEDNIAFGQMVAWGTGGTEGADFIGASKMFYNPEAFNVHALPNVYDKNSDSQFNKCAFFHPVYLNVRGCFDKNGNSDVVKALLEELLAQHKIRKSSSDPNTLIQFKAERPIFPTDALMRKEGSIFPVADLKEYLATIIPQQNSFVSGHFTGELIIDKDGTVKLDPTIEKYPIRDFPLKDNKDKAGAIEIFQKPFTSNNQIPFGRYIAGLDPYDDDESSTNSLGSLIMMDSVTNRIVAEYTGRPRTAKEFYEICYRLLKYYNAICNYENDKKGFFAFMDHKNALHHLADNPQILKDMQMIKLGYYGNKAKGTNSSKQVNMFGRRLLADWLLEPAYGLDIEEDPENEESKIKTYLNLHTLRSIGLIKELIAWHPDINADRVSAMGMLMILKADRDKIIESYTKEMIDEKINDPFFRRFDKKL